MADEKKTTKDAKPKLTKEQKIAKLAEKQKQIKAQIAKLQQADKAKERKADARKKILIGGYVLSQIEKDIAVKAVYEKCIASLKRDDDKELFK